MPVSTVGIKPLGITINKNTVATVFLFIVMPKGFMPTVDTGMVFGGTEAAQDTSYEEMVRLQKQVLNTVSANPSIEAYVAGRGGFGNQNGGFMFLHFKEGKRPTANAIIAQRQQKFADIPGLSVFLRAPP